MDMTAWLVSGAMPAAIAAVACWWAHRLAGPPVAAAVVASSSVAGSRADIGPVESTPDVQPEDAAATAAVGSDRARLAPAILSLGWAVAVSAALLGQRISGGDESSLWWPEDFWQRGYLWLLASAALLGCSAWARWHGGGGRWVVAGLLATATAFTSLPAGEGWEDTEPLHGGWMLLLSTSCLVGWWSLDRLGRRRSERWFPLVVLAMLGGPMLVAATTYGALVQWTIAGISATVVCVLFAAAGRLVAGIGIAYPAVALTTVLVAAGRFYSYENFPWWSYLGLLWLAPLVALADLGIDRRSTRTRVIVAASVAVVVLAASAAWHVGDWQSQ